MSSLLTARLVLLLASVVAASVILRGTGEREMGDSRLASQREPIDIWVPPKSTSWQWQLTGLPVDQTIDAALYDIDLFDNAASVVASLHARGRRVVCYMSAGTFEDWRPDAAQFPSSVLAHEGQRAESCQNDGADEPITHKASPLENPGCVDPPTRRPAAGTSMP